MDMSEVHFSLCPSAARQQMTYGPIPVRAPVVEDPCCKQHQNPFGCCMCCIRVLLSLCSETSEIKKKSAGSNP